MKNCLKDILLLAVVMTGLGGVSVFLLETEPLPNAKNFDIDAERKIKIANSAHKLDQAIAADIEREQLQIAGAAEQQLILRRLSLALTGSLPSIEELRAVEKIPAPDQLNWYVSYLLNDKRTADYLAERFTRVFVGVEKGPFLIYRRRRFRSWLSSEIQQNRPYDQICQSILTASGIWTDRPEVNFYTYNIVGDSEDKGKPDPIRLAGRTSRAFLGMRIDCLQCHDDFIGTINLGAADDPVGGTQLHFHELASFFSQIDTSLTGVYDNLEEENYRYKLLDQTEESTIGPSVPFSQFHDDTDQKNLRVRLAGWITHDDNLPFARTIVNRIWAILFGRGLIQPVNSIPLDGPFPAALEVLTEDFVAGGYDLHQLIRVIASSETFRRSSRADFEIQSKHQSKFAVFPMSKLRPEQVAGSIMQSTSLNTIGSTAHVINRLIKFGMENDFVERFGDTGEDEFNERGETITQRLLLMNGQMVKERLNDDLSSVTRIANLSPSSEKAVETVFLACLCRLPTAAESEFFVAQLNEQTSIAKKRIVQDIYWSLINSVEFTWNH